MEAIDYSRFIFAFLFVVGLIGVLGYFLKKYAGSHKILGIKDSSGRLGVVEIRYIDPKRKLVLIKRDNVEHLLLIGDGKETVIESNIKTMDNKGDV